MKLKTIKVKKRDSGSVLRVAVSEEKLKQQVSNVFPRPEIVKTAPADTRRIGF